MAATASTTTPLTSAIEDRLPLLLILVAASGCAALIYEVVWYQLLPLAIGSTSVSLGILLAAFMGGLCIGSLWLPRILPRRHPLEIYAALELGIGACAILVQFGLPYLNRIYITGAEHGLPGMLLRATLAGICLLPPTILMGASFPVIVRWVERSRSRVNWWGFFYGGNTAGAVLGCLLAGFYLLRIYDMATATYVAAGINLLVAGASLALAAKMPDHGTIHPLTQPAREIASESRWPIYLTIALSGACALAAEVVWTRLLSMLLLGTVYVFSIILAVFLTGLAIGSAAGSSLLKRIDSRAALGWCQILLTVTVAWATYTIVHILPHWKDNVLVTNDAWRMYGLDLNRCLVALLPATLFWGASFPLACAAAAQLGGEPGIVAGEVYAANTVGGIAGALLMSLVLIPGIGSQQSQRLLVITSAAAGWLILVPLFRRSKAAAIALLATIPLVGFLTWKIDPVPGDLIAYGRRMPINAGNSKILYTAEGRNSSVAISEWYNGTVYVNVNGHVEATTELYDMTLQRMVGHLPALLHPDPRSVLGIGFGAGVSAGTFTRYPGIQKITICEIEPVIPPASTKFFAAQNYSVANNPKTHIVFDDARHYLLTTTEKFDIIASDPLDVFIKGTAALYSREYFEAVKEHLNPGGMFTLYVPLYETDEPTIRSELATFFRAFPNGTLWANLRDGLGYDMVFMGQIEPLKIDLDEVQRRFSRPDYAAVRQSLADIDINSPYDLFSTYTGAGSDLRPWTRSALINTDQNLRLSYLAGWGINSDMADRLYREMLKYRQTPAGTFSGSPELLRPLMLVLGGAR
ncbi:MAG TPA: fused MFS/spermidine synthase [Bryobacteraceae bacterium]|nr:fused MFS/spermidine synthase [Bryobacteraceae bacterium]